MNRVVKYRSDYDDDYDRAAKRRKDNGGSAVPNPNGGEHAESQYRTLVLSRLDQRLPDAELAGKICHEFGKYGDLDVEIAGGSVPGCRLVYVHFQRFEDARVAKHELQDKVIIGDSVVHIDAVYGGGKTGPAGGGGHNLAFRDGSPRPIERVPKDRSDGRRDMYPDNRGQMSSMRGDKRYSSGHGYRDDEDSATRTLFVGNLELDITDDEIRREFGRYGFIEDIDIKRGAAQATHRAHNAYAFIRFFNLDMALAAKLDMTGRCVRMNPCKIGFGKATVSNILWIGGIGPWLTRDAVQHEIVTRVPLLAFEWPSGRYYAYATFQSIDCARDAMHWLRGKELGSPGKRLRVDYAEPGQIEASQKPMLNELYNSEIWHRLFAGVAGCYGRSTQGGGSRGSSEYDRRADVGEVPGRVHGDRAILDDRYKHHRDGPFQESRLFQTSGDRTVDANDGVRRFGSDDSRKPKDLWSMTSMAEVPLIATTVWCGALILKSSAFFTRMHLLHGDVRLVDTLLLTKNYPPLSGISIKAQEPLKIGQRLRLDPSKLDELQRRATALGASGCAILVGFPVSSSESEAFESNLPDGIQRRPLKNLMTYLHQKEAAGIVSLPPEGSSNSRTAREVGLLHAFPSCAFAQQLVQKYLPLVKQEELLSQDYITVLIVKTQ